MSGLEGKLAMPMHLPPKLVEARTCYRHFAGALGMAVRDSLLKSGFVNGTDDVERAQYFVTRSGTAWAERLGIHSSAKLTACMDHSHRSPHLAGPWAVGLCAFMFANGFVKRGETARQVLVTESGQAFLSRELDLTWTTTKRSES